MNMLKLVTLLVLASASSLVAGSYQGKTWAEFCSHNSYTTQLAQLTGHVGRYAKDEVVGAERLAGLTEDLATINALIAQAQEFVVDHRGDASSIDYKQAIAQIKLLERSQQAIELMLADQFVWASLAKPAAVTAATLAMLGGGYYYRTGIERNGNKALALGKQVAGNLYFHWVPENVAAIAEKIKQFRGVTVHGYDERSWLANKVFAATQIWPFRR